MYKLTFWNRLDATRLIIFERMFCFALNLLTDYELNKTLDVRPGYYVSSLNSKYLSSIITPQRCLSQFSEAPRGHRK